MADLKISALNSLAGADLVAADVVAVVDDSASETKKLTVSDLIANGTTLISDATIPSAKILFSAGAIDTAELAASAVETAKINDSAVTAAKLADNSSVTLVSTLPASGDFTGQIALDTDDDKIYVWDGSAWVSPVASGSINVVNGSTTGEVNIVASTSGSTVTISATLDDTTAAAQFLAGPTGAGGTVGYRAIIGTDLPTASTTAKGGVIVNGNGLTMSSDTIAIDNTVTAETSENHIVQYDANGLVTGGRAIVAADVPNATSTTVGVIKPGSGLGVTAAGELNHDNSVTAGTASKVTFDTEGHITGTESLVAADIPDLDASKITTGTVPTARIASDAVTAEKLADRSTATIAETTPAGGAFIGQCHLNSITGDYFLWDGNVWQPIGISVGEIVLAGTYDASTNLMATVTAEGTALSFVVGSALPAASSANKGYYVVVSTAGTGTSPAPTVSLNPPDFLLSTGTAYTEIDVSGTVTAQQAENVAFTAAGNIAATNVQAAIEELDSEKVAAASPSLTGTVSIGTGGTIEFEGASANDFETTLTVTDPTADRTITLPDVTGTVVTTGDTGSVTSTMITDGTIVNADISASAEIAVSKLANGTARQLLQTDVAGSGVEFTSNVDVPGTLDVTGAATLDSTLDVTGATTVTGVINADGKIKFPAGSASAPSFYSGTDTNTGLYFSAADEISVATGGTQRVVVDSSGDVGIGTSSPAFTTGSGLEVERAGVTTVRVENTTNNKALEIVANSSGILFDSRGASAITTFGIGGSEKLRIDNSGRLLVGTTTEGESTADDLTIATSGHTGITIRSGTSSEGNIFFSDGTSGADEIRGAVRYYHSNNSLTFTSDNSERMRIDSSGRLLLGTTSTSSSNLLVVAGTTGGNPGFIHLQTKSTSPGSTDQLGGLNLGTAADPAAARFMALRDGGTWTAGSSTPTAITVSTTADGSSSPTERLRIDSSGNVGIGTSSPSQSLTLRGEQFIETNSTAADSGNGIYWQSTTSGWTTSSAHAAIYGKRVNANNGYLRFDTRSGGTTAERVRIDSSGRVGIANSSPGSFYSGSNQLVVGNTGDQGITIKTSTTGVGRFHFADGTTGAEAYRGRIEYVHSDDLMRFGSAGNTAHLVIDSSGNVGINTTSPSHKLDVRLNNTAAARIGGSTFAMEIGQLGSSSSPGFNAVGGSASMLFRIGGTEAMRIDPSRRLLVGTTTEGHSFADNLTLNDSGNCGLTIRSGSDDNGSIYFSDATSGAGEYDGWIAYNQANRFFQFATAQTERMRIDSSGRLLVGRTSSTGSGEDIQDSKGGIRAIPQNSKTAAYTLVVGDVGKHINITTGGVTVPSGVFSTGDAVTIYNDSSSDQTVTQGSSVTLRSAGTADTGNRTLAQRGICTLLCVASNEFVISGAGLS